MAAQAAVSEHGFLDDVVADQQRGPGSVQVTDVRLLGRVQRQLQLLRPGLSQLQVSPQLGLARPGGVQLGQGQLWERGQLQTSRPHPGRTSHLLLHAM